jgi:urea transport system ATP-binding protein
MTAPSPMLTVRGLRAGYGSTPILQGIELDVARGEIVAVIGRNGVGKTTLMKSLIGLLPAWEGSIEYDGTRVEAEAADRRARRGIGYIPQGREVFPRLTVAENLMMGRSVGGGRKPGLEALV